MWGLLDRLWNRSGESGTEDSGTEESNPEPATASERAVKAPLSEIEDPAEPES